MLGVLNKFFDPAKRRINSLQQEVDKINELEPQFKEKNDEELRTYSLELKDKIRSEIADLDRDSEDYAEQEQEVLNKYLYGAYALVREVFSRTLGERSHDEQLMVSILLHRGHAAEQKTGEGKTHASVHPLYLNALTGRGAHSVTVNDYLARRDTEWMGWVYHRLGLTAGCINSNGKAYLFDPGESGDNFELQNIKAVEFGKGDYLREVTRREAYQADITHGTNNEYGFDYLRDNMVHSLKDLVQVNPIGEVGVHHYAIVDEVDSILIDEARTPLIISAPAEESNELYQKFAGLVKRLNSEDYDLDEKARQVLLNDLGVKKLENWLGVENLFDDFDLAHHLEQALKAQFAYEKDRDYVVQDGQVMIVDEFTGRLMEGRRYSEGLHQALEAKEGVTIQKESKTVATITLQNYFRMYEKLAGMSATIMTESEEFYKIYKLDSVPVPTHKPVARKDNPDKIYKHQRAKWKAIVDEIAEINKTGQPILVGTTSVENNELVSQLLKRRGVSHEVLNAKNHAREAEIVMAAGQQGSVTVATNMAGRGTDIKLGEGVKELGGLHVIGTERHEARRIDNQLRGRSGRQGDPGSSRFFVALDDPLMRIFNGERIAALMERFNLPDDMPIENTIVSRSIESAQQKVEGHNFDIRKHLVEYDDVINKQRDIIYQRRRRLLEMGEEIDDNEESSLEREMLQKAETHAENFDEFKEDLQHKKQLLGSEQFGSLLRFVILNTLDKLWMDHIDALSELRSGVGLRGYGQRDPLVEFKNEGYRLFEKLINDIDFEIVQRFHNMKIRTPDSVRIQSDNVLDKAQAQHQAIGQYAARETVGAGAQAQSSQGQTAQNQPRQVKTSDGTTATVVRTGDQGTFEKSDKAKDLSRNDPCPCGSGKKWKNCHYPDVP